VLSGGELPAMACIDAVTRLIPGVLGDSESAKQDSFSDGLLDCPHYTRPEKFAGIKVPEVLLSGNHQAISNWRLKQKLGRTWQQRPDLLQAVNLDDEQRNLLQLYQTEHEGDQYEQHYP
jgi:tRNA (guanine37-N1)-methyltransferase